MLQPSILPLIDLEAIWGIALVQVCSSVLPSDVSRIVASSVCTSEGLVALRAGQDFMSSIYVAWRSVGSDDDGSRGSGGMARTR